jgi:hypothetical protein
MRQMIIKPRMVPMTPRKLIMPKCSKNNDFLSEYPAEKMMGGSMMAKNISLLKIISPSSPFIAKFVRT